MGDIGQKVGILAHCRSQLLLHTAVFLLLPPSSVDSVSGNDYRPHNSAGTHQKAQHITAPHAVADGVKQQKMIQKLGCIQGYGYVQETLPVQQGEKQKHDAGYKRNVKKTGFMYPEKEELC